MQLTFPKGRTVTGAFYKNVLLKKLRAHFKRVRPNTGLKHLRLLHDRAPAHTVHILESEKVNVLLRPPFSPDLALCGHFLFPKLNFHRLEKDMSRNTLGSTVCQFLMDVPFQDYERCFQNWIGRL